MTRQQVLPFSDRNRMPRYYYVSSAYSPVESASADCGAIPKTPTSHLPEQETETQTQATNIKLSIIIFLPEIKLQNVVIEQVISPLTEDWICPSPPHLLTSFYFVMCDGCHAEI
jgi:hypothetical protein